MLKDKLNEVSFVVLAKIDAKIPALADSEVLEVSDVS